MTHVAVRLFTIATLSLLIGCCASAQAAPPEDNALLRSYLEAGEFAPAVDMARSAANSPTKHDAILQQVAEAQSVAGDRQAALHSVAMISSDRTATDTISSLKPQSASVQDVKARPRGFQGGNQADFDALIDLITSTIAAQTWSDVGGPGSIQSFDGGVSVDAEGVLRPIMQRDKGLRLQAIRQAAAKSSAQSSVNENSALRKISLVRLERQTQLLAAQGKRATDEMQTLAGLQRIKYVLVYPEEGDIVIAGPAGSVTTDAEGRPVNPDSNRPALRLDDLIVVLRHMLARPDSRFGCNITPTQTSLAEVQKFLDETGKTPLKPGQRDGWLKQLRSKLGQQEVEVYGIDPRTRAGLVLVEADYRMKLIGMGLEEGTIDVPSYLSMIKVPPGKSPPPMDVLRWWFTLNYDSVVASADHDSFEIKGQGVKVLSENELLAANGQQVHTGESDTLNSQFAQNFTKHFEDLAVKYPVYAELRNLCDMALVGALLRAEHIPDKVRWQMSYFGDPKQYEVPAANTPKLVDTVINHRVVNQTNIIVGVSGGVRIDPNSLVRGGAIKTDDYGLLKATRSSSPPDKTDETKSRWWWD
jgi:hypothetical protein